MLHYPSGPCPYQEHDAEATYYTFSYDLSDFQSYQAGLGVTYQPCDHLKRKRTVSALSLKHAGCHRSDRLRSHIISPAVPVHIGR